MEREYTQIEVHPDRLSILKYLIFSAIFGLTFVMKIMEGGEEKAQETYNKISGEIPVSVVKSLSLRKMFSTMIFITLGVGAISFLIGWIAKVVLNL